MNKNEGRRVAAVVVTYDRLELLQQCVACLRAQEGAACDILLVDNASTDGTRAWAEGQSGLRYENTGANLGGAGGFAFGIRRACGLGYTHLWLMDDDTLPKPDALAALLEADDLLGGRYGYLSGAALWTDGTECNMNRPKFTGKKGPVPELRPLTQATFVSLLLPVATVQKVGLPIKEFFIWGDDIEYTRRIAVRGKMPSYQVRNSQAVHAMKQNTGSNIALDDAGRVERYRYAFRNENYIYRQEGVSGFCYYLAKCGLNLLRVMTRAKDHRAERLYVILSCMGKGLLFNPPVEYLPAAPEMGEQ